MEIKPIKTEADYEAALKDIEQCWSSSYGSPEGAAILYINCVSPFGFMNTPQV